jgi:cellulose synthase/poly-beta-1,6-N-acetylglucosamine synthase-like glycosyltransferase
VSWCLTLALIPSAVLLLCSCLVAARRWQAPALPGADVSPAAITALIPVRDEERNVAACLAGLLSSPGPIELLVIDDGSGDATPRIVAACLSAARNARLLRARELPPGWRGKVNALATAFDMVRTPWTLLVDADSRVQPEAPVRALAHARANGLAAVSLAARQEAGSFGEDLLVPPVFGLLDFLLGSWSRAAAGGPPVSSGQFLLVSTEALRAAGGFEAIREATLDDVALIRLLRGNGHRTGFVRAPELLSVRMYDGLRSALAGWRRNLAGFLGAEGATMLAILVLLMLPAATLAALAGAGQGTALAGAYLLGFAASAANRISGRQRVLAALLWPVECFVLAMVLALAWRDRRAGQLPPWKGREIRL